MSHTHTNTHLYSHTLTFTHAHSHSHSHSHMFPHILVLTLRSLCLSRSLTEYHSRTCNKIISPAFYFFSRDLERTRRLSVQLPLLFPECQRNEIPRREAGVELFCHKSREKSPVYPIDYSMGGPRFCYHPVPVLRENFVTPAEFSRRMPLREVGGLIEGPRLMHLSASCGETEAG